MLREYLRQRLARTGANAPGAVADVPDYVEGVDYDYCRNRNASSAGFGVATRDLYINRRGFLKQETSDALHELLGNSKSDARASLDRLVRWEQPTDDHGIPVPISEDVGKDYAAEVSHIVRYISARQQPLITGDRGMGKIFFANLTKAMKLHGTDDPVALLEQFKTLPDAVRECFNPAERDALSFEEIRAKTIPLAKEYMHLQKLSRVLRKEATDALGEEAMRPVPVFRESRGDGTVTKNGERTGNAR